MTTEFRVGDIVEIQHGLNKGEYGTIIKLEYLFKPGVSDDAVATIRPFNRPPPVIRSRDFSPWVDLRRRDLAYHVNWLQHISPIEELVIQTEGINGE